jgi:hypothetical protein
MSSLALSCREPPGTRPLGGPPAGRPSYSVPGHRGHIRWRRRGDLGRRRNGRRLGWGRASTWFEAGDVLTANDGDDLLASVGSDVADDLWPDELTDPWPVCPRHGDHPLQLQLDRGGAAWVCFRDPAVAVRVGDLRAASNHTVRPGDRERACTDRHGSRRPGGTGRGRRSTRRTCVLRTVDSPG